MTDYLKIKDWKRYTIPTLAGRTESYIKYHTKYYLSEILLEIKKVTI